MAGEPVLSVLGGEPRKARASAGTLLGVSAGKSARSYALLSVLFLLARTDAPSFLFTFVLLAVSAAVIFLDQRSWIKKRRAVSLRQWTQVTKLGVLQAAGLILWVLGARMVGGFWAVFLAEYIAIWQLIATEYSGRTGKSALFLLRMRGTRIAGVGLFICLLAQLYRDFFEANAALEKTSFATGTGSCTIGLVLGLCGQLLWLRSRDSKLLDDLGGAKRFYSFSLPVAAAVLSPFAFVEILVYPFDPVIQLFSSTGFVILASLLILALDIYLDAFASLRQERVYLFVNSFWASSLTILGTYLLFVGHFTWSLVDIAALVVMITGIILLPDRKFVESFGKDAEALSGSLGVPIFASPSASSYDHGDGSESKSNMSIMQEIMRNQDSRNIFLYLLLNVSFMFVEMVYGLWTNSLGLISDAAHMAFDSTALAVGLYASVVSKWGANRRYTYGYGRVEVLSGYINGVYLVLIAFFILVEAVERIQRPPKLNTDKLLLVSFAGLCVNLVGVFAFGHAHGGHGHSHGGGHGHSHGAKHGAGHGHTHGSGHGHAHGSGHGHAHGSGHGHAHGSGHGHVHDGGHGHAHNGGHGHAHDGGHGHAHGGSNGHAHGGGHGHAHSGKHDTLQAGLGAHGYLPSVEKSHIGDGSAAAHRVEKDSYGHAHDHGHSHHGSTHSHGAALGSGHGHSHGEDFGHEDCFDNGHGHAHSSHVEDRAPRRHGEHSHSHGHQVGHSSHDDGFEPVAPFSHERRHTEMTFGHPADDIDEHDEGIEDGGENEHHLNSNMQGVFLHVLADTLGSVGVITSTLLIQFFGWYIADPLCSMFIAVLVCASVVPLIRSSASVLLQQTPSHLDRPFKRVVKKLAALPGVHYCTNAHLWQHSDEKTVATVHLIVSAESPTQQILRDAIVMVQSIGIQEVTVQVSPAPNAVQ